VLVLPNPSAPVRSHGDLKGKPSHGPVVQSSFSAIIEFSLPMASTRKPRLESRWMLAIAIFKIVKGLGLLAVGFGALHFLHRDLAAEIAHWVDLVRIDPHNHYLHWILEKLANVDEKKLRELSVGTFFYSALFLCEGTGLLLRKRWAAYMTIISTASLMPIEVLEICRRPTAARMFLLLVNVAVVAYLVREMRRTPAPADRVLRRERRSRPCGLKQASDHNPRR